MSAKRKRRTAARARTKSAIAAASQSTQQVQRPETRWRGASRQIRALSNWSPTVGSGRSDLPPAERRTLVARSHDAYRSYPLARAAVTRLKTNVVGTGLIAHPDVDARALGITEEQAAELNALLESRWRMWAENPLECDSEATLDFYGDTALVDVATMLSGDVFALTPFEQRPGCIFGLKIQLIDSARVSNPDNRPDTVTLCEGVEFNADGSPKQIWIRRRHPDDKYLQLDGWDAYPVFGPSGRRRVLHNWNEKDRVAAARGAPFLAPILEPLQTIEGYTRSEMLAALVSSFLTVLLKKTQSPQLNAAGNPLAAFGGEKKAESITTTVATYLEMGPAAFVDLAPGEDPEIVNPMRPNSRFEPFMMTIATYMGAALELPVDELLLRYQASYSAARAAMLQAWRYYLLRRWHRVQQFCQPVRSLWFDEAVARGIIPTTDYADPMRRAAYNRCIWTGPARGSMDEQKEASAAEKRIQIGISNETIETAQMMGEDWSSVYAQRKREIERRKKDGTWVEPKGSGGADPEEPDDSENRERNDSEETEDETDKNPAASWVRRSRRKR